MERAIETNRDFHFTDKDFNEIRTLVKTHTGITLSDAKKNMVYSRLSRRLRQLDIHAFKDYIKLIKSDQSDEFTNFTNAITTNLTSFFRENHHFDYLKNTVLPGLFADKTRGKKIRIWCCASSTGEEPYSIAITVKEAMPKNETWDVKIIATDLDSNVLQKAESGIYDVERIDGIKANTRKLWFWKGKGKNEGVVRVNPELQEMITFKQLNLLNNWPFSGPFDIVFCRNVVIYFDKDTQRVLFDRIANVMSKNNPHLFIGHSESLFKVSDRYKLIGQTIYTKIN